MSYYKVLGLNKEPFSTSPDPSLFYLSKEHRAALYRLRISVKLRRGLSLILGDVGTGKTTLSRRFAQTLAHEPKVEAHMILNPIFSDESDFLKEICRRFGVDASRLDRMGCFNEIEGYLFRKGYNEGRTIVLMIDEAQKLNDACLEALRGLLNYETNEHKLLQLILVSQDELVPRISRIRNFWDRISLKHRLPPLSYPEMKEMISFRLRAVGYQSPVQLFSEEAAQLVYRATSGFPRQVTQMCHDCLEYLVMHNKSYVDRALVDEILEREHTFASSPDTIGANHDRIERRSAEKAHAGRAAV